MHFLITSGPTREPIDAVRFISNRSSGKMGMAIARAAAEAGHEVTCLMGPGTAEPPTSAKIFRFESCSDLNRLLEEHFPDCDVLVMAAAVSDYQPTETIDGKMPRESRPEVQLRLRSTPDLVTRMVARKQPHQRVIAFALEEEDQLDRRALEKLQRKGADAIVANPLSTMDDEMVTPRWITAAGDHESPGRLSKSEFGHWLINRCTGSA